MEGGFIFLGTGVCPRCGWRSFLWGYGPHTLCSTCRKEFNMHMERVVTITDSLIFISDAMPEDDAKALALIYASQQRSRQVLRVEGPLKMLHILEQYQTARPA